MASGRRFWPCSGGDPKQEVMAPHKKLLLSDLCSDSESQANKVSKTLSPPPQAESTEPSETPRSIIKKEELEAAISRKWFLFHAEKTSCVRTRQLQKVRSYKTSML